MNFHVDELLSYAYSNHKMKNWLDFSVEEGVKLLRLRNHTMNILQYHLREDLITSMFILIQQEIIIHLCIMTSYIQSVLFSREALKNGMGES